MQTPRYYFAHDYDPFHGYFLSQPHQKKAFKKGDFLWKPNQPHGKIYYILSGMAMHYVNHENGHRKIISFHGSGTVFPGYHRLDFKIELSLIVEALTDMEVLEFTKDGFQNMFETNVDLSEKVVDWYAMYVNRFLFESAHQEHNTSLMKICNLLYLLTENRLSCSSSAIDMTQDEIADILGLSRVHVARGLSELREKNIILTQRKQIQVTDLPALETYCSEETRS